ncbi:sterol desaturase family protein [Thiocapsa rosea]|uniref:Sterol desaturase/sphingolipid hydroxylase (Fatty acid hydroxylase superfamily) n=1 Tax=Thiocapsa rosea TaxID=69360 RepID=A0A495VIJ3_9GAMM|nr:sterol desaturase family protein [Thiocapsa rosea]RKT47678.1 sterol desaturase/sphingolipid hydroxylase (fatty acid hydroxylase superfamily) [Thiocapsa rosea]
MSIDQWAGLAVLTTLFALEGVIPFYDQASGRWSHAARNIGLALMAGLVGALMAPLILMSIELAKTRGWGLLNAIDMPAAIAVVAGLLLFDGWMYLWHRANHEIPLLWRLHRVHHTDPRMDSTTAFRFHPGEIALSTLLNTAVILVLGLGLATLILYKFLMVMVIVLHHSNIRVPEAWDRRLRILVVPPSMHRVHHSEITAETNSNYGTIFSFWDRFLGSFRLRDDLHRIRFGIGYFEGPQWQTPLQLLMLPVQEKPHA